MMHGFGGYPSTFQLATVTGWGYLASQGGQPDVLMEVGECGSGIGFHLLLNEGVY